MTDNLSRCLAYLGKLPPAVAGSGGHNATLRAACECVRFGLSDSEAWQALTWFNENRCSPIWEEKELQHKLVSAKKKARFGERAQGGRMNSTFKPVSGDDLIRHLDQRAARKATRAAAAVAQQLPAVSIMYRPEAEEEAWWAAVFAERGIPDPAPAPAPPGMSANMPAPPEAPPDWDGATVDIRDWPAFKRAHGLRVTGAEWRPGTPSPTLFVEPAPAPSAGG